MKRLILLLSALFTLFVTSCGIPSDQKSDTGIAKAHTTIKTDANGQTIEQRNII